ncbi:MAG: CopG family transcriptional regulator [Deltaproteobacteria bacterium]|nr:CopG family transcriptional regulator [Deltaproteobacteria bacterium]
MTKRVDKGVIQSNNFIMNPPKEAIITFKVDAALSEAMKGVANRSEFIRSAVLAALDSICPLCSGSGVLTLNQMRHWQEFASSHVFEECRDCHEIRLVCAREQGKKMALAKAERRGK